MHDEKLLMHFQNSLRRAVLSWYMRLDNTQIRSWKDLVHAFIKQYKFNIGMTPNKSSLLVLEKGSSWISLRVCSTIERKGYLSWSAPTWEKNDQST